jgi:hypothetical protein
MTSLAYEELELNANAAPAQLVHANVYDPSIAYLESVNPGRVAHIQALERVMNNASKLLYPFWRHREQAIAYEQSSATSSFEEAEETIAHGDRKSRDRFFNDPFFLGDAGLKAWQSNIPHATALMPLSNPFNSVTVQDRNGVEVPTTPMTQEWMAACTDGWEIRNRSAIMVDQMGTFLQRYAEVHPNERLTVVSVAGGTALPTMQAIMRSGVDPSRIQLVLVESDKRAVAAAADFAERIGFQGAIVHKDVNVFDPKEMAALHEELQAEGAKVAALDAVGIAEYSSTQHRKRAYEQRFGKDYMLYNPDKFLESCLKMVDEDGMAIIGQMMSMSIRPNPYFTRGVVSWPRVTMRKPGRFMELLQQGGANKDLTRLILTPLKAYAMAVIHKSEAGAQLGNVIPITAVSEGRLSTRAAQQGSRRRRAGIAASILAAATWVSAAS